MNNIFKKGMILILACVTLFGAAVACKGNTNEPIDPVGGSITIIDPNTDDPIIITEKPEQPATYQGERPGTDEPVSPPEEEDAPTAQTAEYAAPDPDRFNFGMAMTPEEIQEITGSEAYQNADHKQELYDLLTINRADTFYSKYRSDYYTSNSYVTIPQFDDDEAEFDFQSGIQVNNAYYPYSCPDYTSIEYFNLPETKTNYLVFVSDDGHREIVSMYEDVYGYILFQYIGSDPELYVMLTEIATRLTRDDVLR